MAGIPTQQEIRAFLDYFGFDTATKNEMDNWEKLGKHL